MQLSIFLGRNERGYPLMRPFSLSACAVSLSIPTLWADKGSMGESPPSHCSSFDRKGWRQGVSVQVRSSVANNDTNAWIVNFDNGKVNWNNRDNQYRVRLVRGALR